VGRGVHEPRHTDDGSGAGDFAVCPPGWQGELPAGVRRYDAPTPWVWIIGRTQASVETYDKVHAFQAGLTITPLSSWPNQPPAVTGSVDPAIDATTPPLRQVFALDAAAFFGCAAELLKEHAPHAQDYPVLDRLAQIAFHVGQSFDLAGADTVVQDALAKAVPAAQQRISDEQKKIGWHAGSWLMNTEAMGNYGTNYLRRACIELIGLGANLQEDAVYPLVFTDADNEPLTGERSYVWHMETNEIPPVHAFWSLTLYDAEGFQVANPLNRFAIGDRNTLKFNDNGSLDIYIQHGEPAEGPSNWLPAPEGGFNLTARLYYPRPEALDGTWEPAAIHKR
jgi:hypothetical protein